MLKHIFFSDIHSRTYPTFTPILSQQFEVALMSAEWWEEMKRYLMSNFHIKKSRNFKLIV